MLSCHLSVDIVGTGLKPVLMFCTFHVLSPLDLLVRRIAVPPECLALKNPLSGGEKICYERIILPLN
jgi:hypothetical protein